MKVAEVGKNSSKGPFTSAKVTRSIITVINVSGKPVIIKQQSQAHS